ncbi:spondin domain-containing protein [Rubricoccus marinus]|uniref:Spondin domain-containing protein n=1 Tax=Rubricoccus marinus TaxID=716817 RepID=A0A259TY68_9BACT|nr:spondin domain-containing protein [Rubricoccus marinus]OZC02636.1 hypothetical protein BSZ36_06395 [Rubricoccus marinus]
MRLVLSLCLVLLFSGAALAQSSATYFVTLEATWSAQTHPDGFPGDPHFSPLVGAVHAEGAKLWEAGGIASGGIEAMAETGSTGALHAEVDALRASGSALHVVQGGGIRVSPGSVGLELTATDTHALVTLVSMIAPSPDWFVGTEGLDLRDTEGAWRAEIRQPLYVWDAGTDSGPSYTSGDADTDPQEPIARIEAAPFVVGGTLTPVGTITFTLLNVVETERAPEAAASLRVWPQPMGGGAGTVALTLPASGDAEVVLYDVRGRRVHVLHDGPLASGETALRLDASGLAPGVYVLRAAIGAEVQTQRVVVAR